MNQPPDIYELFFEQHEKEIDPDVGLTALARIGFGPRSDGDGGLVQTLYFLDAPRPEFFVPGYIRSKIESERYLELMGDEEPRPAEFRLFRDEYYRRAIRDSRYNPILVYDITSPDFGALFVAFEKESGSEDHSGCTLHSTIEELVSNYQERGRILEAGELQDQGDGGTEG